MLTELAFITGLGLVTSLLLTVARKRFSPATDELIDNINRVLPQTQCAQCGYPGCRPYAEAIAAGAAINRCPPGGEQTITLLADMLGREASPLDPDCGEPTGPVVARIREAECIGCTLCIVACPVDAIIGAQHTMHTVIEADCTGCDLCREPCPVDCIDLVELPVDKQPTSFPVHEEPCINCGLCAQACPRDLQPSLLLWYRKDTNKLNDLNLMDCIECRLCDNICPSDIPLTANFKVSKTIRQAKLLADQTATEAEQRYEQRQRRLAAAQQRVVKRPDKTTRDKLLQQLKEST